MARRRRAAWLWASAAAAACAPEPPDDFRLPWWPAPRVAAPSPLLDAVGLAPLPLAGPGCHRGGSTERSGLQGALARLVSGFEVTCFVPPAAAGGTDTGGYAAVTFDGRAQAESAHRRSVVMAPAAAAAEADGMIRRGLARSGARPLACRMEGWPYGVFRSDVWVPLVHGWRTPDYEALVLAYPVGLDPALGHVVHLRVTRLGFAACRPRRGRPGGAGDA